MPYCSNCGNKITPTQKFCSECGVKLEHGGISLAGNWSSEDKTRSAREGRYDGIIHKCPHCGSPISPTDAICDECGQHIAGRSACSSVHEFSRRIMEIERSKQGDGILDIVAKSLFDKSSSIDEQKLLLIKTFPIPNTVEDLSEFMFMAASNVDVAKSKRGMFGKPKGYGIELEMSEAWVSKMKQMYQKAKMAFSKDPEFAQIEEIYVVKMAELNISAS